MSKETYAIGYMLLFAVNMWLLLTTEHLIVMLGASACMFASGCMVIKSVSDYLDDLRKK